MFIHGYFISAFLGVSVVKTAFQNLKKPDDFLQKPFKSERKFAKTCKNLQFLAKIDKNLQFFCVFGRKQFRPQAVQRANN
jgi:hypothetical protein